MKRLILQVLLVFVAIISLTLLFFRGSELTGLSIAQDMQEFSVDRNFSSDGEYEIGLSEKTTALRINGKARGEVKIYLVKDGEELLIFEKEKEKSSVSLITGRAVSNLSSKNVTPGKESVEKRTGDVESLSENKDIAANVSLEENKAEIIEPSADEPGNKSDDTVNVIKSNSSTPEPGENMTEEIKINTTENVSVIYESTINSSVEINNTLNRTNESNPLNSSLDSINETSGNPVNSSGILYNETGNITNVTNKAAMNESIVISNQTNGSIVNLNEPINATAAIEKNDTNKTAAKISDKSYDIKAGCVETCSLDNFDTTNASLRVVVDDDSWVYINKILYKTNKPLQVEKIDDISVERTTFVMQPDGYFEDADAYNVTCMGNITANVGEEITFDSVGSGQGLCRIIAYNDAGFAESNYFDISLQEVKQTEMTALKSKRKGDIRVGEDVAWELEAKGSEVRIILPGQAFEISVSGAEFTENDLVLEEKKKIHPNLGPVSRVKEVVIKESGEFTLEYKTPGPRLNIQKYSENMKYLKLESDFEYDKVNIFLKNNGSVKLFEVNGSGVDFEYVDQDNDGKSDGISWTASTDDEFLLNQGSLSVGAVEMDGDTFRVQVNTTGNGTLYVNSRDVVFTNASQEFKIVTTDGQVVPYRVYELKKRIGNLRSN